MGGRLNLTRLYSRFASETAAGIVDALGSYRPYTAEEIVSGMRGDGRVVAGGLAQCREQILDRMTDPDQESRFETYYRGLSQAILTGDHRFPLYVYRLRKEELETNLGDLHDTAHYLPYTVSVIPDRFRRVYMARDASSYFECEALLNRMRGRPFDSQIVYVSRFLLGDVYERFTTYRVELLAEEAAYGSVLDDGELFLERMYDRFRRDYDEDHEFRSSARKLFDLVQESVPAVNGGKKNQWCDIGFFGTIPIALKFMYELERDEESVIFSAESYITSSGNVPVLSGSSPIETGLPQISVARLEREFGFDRSTAIRAKRCTAATCGADYPQPMRPVFGCGTGCGFVDEEPMVLLGSRLRSILFYNGVLEFLDKEGSR